MKPILVPINFSLSSRAVDEIRRLTQQLEASEGKSFLPALLWDQAYDEIDFRMIHHGFVLGWYEVSEMPTEVVQSVSGLRLLFAVTAEQAEHFQSRTIDFDGKRFLFSEPN